MRHGPPAWSNTPMVCSPSCSPNADSIISIQHMPSATHLISFLRSVESHRSSRLPLKIAREVLWRPIFSFENTPPTNTNCFRRVSMTTWLTYWLSASLPCMHFVEWEAVFEVGACSRVTKPVGGNEVFACSTCKGFKMRYAYTLTLKCSFYTEAPRGFTMLWKITFCMSDFFNRKIPVTKFSIHA